MVEEFEPEQELLEESEPEQAPQRYAALRLGVGAVETPLFENPPILGVEGGKGLWSKGVHMGLRSLAYNGSCWSQYRTVYVMGP